MNLIKLIVLLVFITPICLTAQSLGEPLSKWSIGLNFSPDHSYRILKGTDRTQFIVNYRNDIERPKPSLTAGLMMTYQLNEKINLEAGLLYADKGENTKTVFPNYLLPNGQPDPNAPISYSDKYHEIYIDIPLKIAYNIKKSKISYFFSGGISPNLYLGSRRTHFATYANNNFRVYQTNGRVGNSLLNIAFIASGGIKYNLSKQIILRVEPTYRQSFTSTVFRSEMKYYYYSIGLNVGIFYAFKTKQ